MDQDDLPLSVDVLCLGTGLPESVLAAAVAKAGQTVLHLDPFDFYGMRWSAFTLAQFAETIDDAEQEEHDGELAAATLLKDGERLIATRRPKDPRREIRSRWHEQSEEKTGADVEETHRQVLEREQRRIVVDLAPKVVVSRSSTVETLVASKTASYVEFKCVDRLLATTSKLDPQDDDRLSVIQVPASRADVFQSAELTLAEKRQLMSVVSACIAWAKKRESAENRDKEDEELEKVQFADFLAKSAGISSGKVRALVVDSLAMLSEGDTAKEGLLAVCRFLDSVGRFGASPLLFPLFGCADLPQAFCRLAAVHGAIYCLQQSASHFVLNGNRVVAILMSGKTPRRVDCSQVVLNVEAAPEIWIRQEDDRKRLHRAVFLIKNSILEASKQHISILRLKSTFPREKPVLLEVGSEACVAPKGYYLLHATMETDDGEEETAQFWDKLARRLSIQPLWSATWSQPQRSAASGDLPENVQLLGAPDSRLEYDEVLDQCRHSFLRLSPAAEFFPAAAPKGDEDDPEDVLCQLAGQIDSDKKTQSVHDDDGGDASTST